MSGLEAIGIAASIIQIADTGIKLAENIHAYADSVQSADAKLSKVASDVRLTANLVGHVGTLFKEEELGNGAGEKEMRTAKDCIRRCEGAYAEVEGYLVKAKKSKWMFPLRERKLDVLNARLDQLKNDLHLMLSIVKNRNDLKVAVERRDHLEQRDVYFLKEIDVLRRAQHASEVRYRTLKTAYERATEDESDDDETVINDEDHAGERSDAQVRRTVDIEDQAALSASLKINLGDMSTTSLTALPVSRSTSPLPTPRITSSDFVKPPDDVFGISSPVHDDDDENNEATHFDQHDLAHLSSHLQSLLSQVTNLQRHLQDQHSTRVSAQDTHRFLTNFNQVNTCIERAQDSFHTPSSATLGGRPAPDCTHPYYLTGRGPLPHALNFAHAEKLDSLNSTSENLPVSAEGLRRAASRRKASALESTIDIISYGYNSIPSPFKQSNSDALLSPPPVSGVTSPGVVESAMGAVRSGLAWLPSPSTVAFGMGSTADKEDVGTDDEEEEDEDEVAKKNGGFPWWKREVVDAGPNVDEVERLLRTYTNVLDEV